MSKTSMENVEFLGFPLYVLKILQFQYQIPNTHPRM